MTAPHPAAPLSLSTVDALELIRLLRHSHAAGRITAIYSVHEPATLAAPVSDTRQRRVGMAVARKVSET